jgi:hypothetical protein
MADIIVYVLIFGLVIFSAVNRKRIDNFFLDLIGGKKYAAQKKAHPPVEMEHGTWQDPDKGIEYTYSRGQFRGNTLKISMRCDTPGDFKVTKENDLDRFFKKWGICAKIKTGDGLFDSVFFINTGTVDFAKAYFAKFQHRRLVEKIFAFGIIGKIKCVGKKITVYSLPFLIADQRSRGVIKEIAALLLEMTKDIPVVAGPDEQEPIDWKRKRAAAFCIPLFYVLLFLLLRGSARYPVLDSAKIFHYALLFAISIWFIYLWAAVKLLKGRTNSHLELLAAAVLAFVVFTASGKGTLEYINGRFDKSTPVSHHTLIVGKYKDTSLRFIATYYYLRVKSWRRPGNDLLGIDAGFYEMALPGKTGITVTTKAGFLGYEWITAAGE